MMHNHAHLLGLESECWNTRDGISFAQQFSSQLIDHSAVNHNYKEVLMKGEADGSKSSTTHQSVT